MEDEFDSEAELEVPSSDIEEGGEGEGLAPPEPPGEQAPAEQQARPQPADPYEPLLQSLAPGLPYGLRRQVEAGQLTMQDAIAKHYQGLPAVKGQMEKQLKRQEAAASKVEERLGAFIKKMSDTLGISLEEAQEQVEANPNAAVEQKLDAVLSQNQEMQIDREVDYTQSFSRAAEEQILAVEPEYMSAAEHVVLSIIAAQRQQATQQLQLYGMTGNVEHLRGLEEFLRARVSGEIGDDAELVEVIALSRAQDAAAYTMQRHRQAGTNYCEEVLSLARQWGWSPPRERNGGGQQAQTQQTAQPRMQRRDPQLERVKSGMTQYPAPSGTGGFNAKHVHERLAALTDDEWGAIVDADDAPPEEVLRRLIAS